MWQTERFERKFPLPEGTASQALALLCAYAAPDAHHPRNIVNSVYFDTIELESYSDAVNGDYRKGKIRARWYGEPPYDDTVDLFIERKSKTGFKSGKVRTLCSMSGRTLCDDVIGQTMRYLQIESAVRSLGESSASWFRPIIHIRYIRHRFSDPSTGTPISLDLAIHSQLLEGSICLSPGWLVLRNAVIEIKGNMAMFPPSLRAVRRYMKVWTSFSKYTRCLDSHLERPGSIGAQTAL